MPPVDTPDNTFHDGNPLTGELGTIVTAAHLNNVQDAVRDTQEELIAVLAAAGNAPDSSAGQLLAALQLLFAAKNDTLGALASLVGANNKLPYFTGANAAALTDISDIGRSVIGQSSIANLLTYLGLGYGSTLPVGTPIPWPTSTAPAGWIKCNGSTFTAAQYPKLALAYPGLVLPDLRGQFIRGWDDGKNIDTGRTLLSTQTDALQAITGTVNLAGTSLTQGIAFNASGAFTTGALTESTFSASNVNPNTRSNTLNFSAANVARTATETRPVNIAFNYIVRAA